MRKRSGTRLGLGAIVLMLCTACPEVERKIYTFDLKAKTGTLVFENIVTDTPDKANNDFMDLVNEVIRGTSLEEDHSGWRIGDKKLFKSKGRLDGRTTFSFEDAKGAGIYKHDKKSPYIWCTSRQAEETILSTNGTRLDHTLPGCVAWDRKATVLEVTVRSATLTGGEQTLLESFKEWDAGEELVLNDDPAAGMEGFGDLFAGGLAGELASAMAGENTVSVGPLEVVGADASEGEKAFGPLQQSVFKMCLAPSAGVKTALKEVVVIQVRPDGTMALKVEESTAPDAERTKCYTEALTDVTFSPKKDVWAIRIPMSITPAP